MADPTSASFICPVDGEPSGSADILLQWVIAAPFNYDVPHFLAPGFNVLSPGISGSQVYSIVAIIPPADNTQTLTLKGITGDTGFEISMNTPTVLAGVKAGFFGVLLGPGLAVTIRTRWL